MPSGRDLHQSMNIIPIALIFIFVISGTIRAGILLISGAISLM